MINFLVIILMQLTPIIFPTQPTPTPVPTYTPVPWDSESNLPLLEMKAFLATADANLTNAPADLRKSNGAILPGTDGSPIFGYAKWLMSPATANEIFGPFGLPISHIVIAVTLVIILAIVYFVLYIAVLIIRFIVWLINLGFKFIPFMG